MRFTEPYDTSFDDDDNETLFTELCIGIEFITYFTSPQLSRTPHSCGCFHERFDSLLSICGWVVAHPTEV